MPTVRTVNDRAYIDVLNIGKTGEGIDHILHIERCICFAGFALDTLLALWPLFALWTNFPLRTLLACFALWPLWTGFALRSSFALWPLLTLNTLWYSKVQHQVVRRSRICDGSV